MAKPSSKPAWTVGNPSFGTVTVEPSAGKKQNGWDIAERPARQFMNWLFFNIGEWIDYFETTTDDLIQLQGFYDAVVGPGGFATLADLVTDADYLAGNIKNILITSDQAVSAPITISQDDLNFTFKPGVAIIKGVGAAQGLIIDADRVRINQGRFANFSDPSDIAIQILGTANYTIVSQCYFVNNDTTIEDNGVKSSLSQNIEE